MKKNNGRARQDVSYRKFQNKKIFLTPRHFANGDWIGFDFLGVLEHERLQFSHVSVSSEAARLQKKYQRLFESTLYQCFCFARREPVQSSNL